jgi:hypothetical protein
MPSVDYWYNQVEALKTYAAARPGVLLDDLTNYGFNSATNLSLNVVPEKAGFITIDSLRVPGPIWSGTYPKGLTINLKAFNKPGFTFRGWAKSTTIKLIEKKSSWKYIDDGVNQGTGWYYQNYNDAGWKTGIAEFGYGDDDETTTLSFGANSSNKFITYYFRKNFNVSETDKNAVSFTLNLLRDDGSVVYLNGTEIVRSNMPSGAVTYQTLASSSVSGAEESQFLTFSIDTSLFKIGNNVLAVEVHQNTASSSDVSFDLELLAEIPGAQELLTTEQEFTITVDNSTNLFALYESSGDCILPDTIKENTTLNLSCSPYFAQGNVVIDKGVTLNIEPGVEIQMPEEASIFVNGKILANGTENQRVKFALNPEYTGKNWGAICFINAPDTSKLKYVIIEDASHGPGLTSSIAAISAYKSNLELENIYIGKVARNPVVARYSSIVMKNSYLHSEITGDLINVKYGKASIENCEFVGNKMPDTDAIDYDDINNGIIRRCVIHNFHGSNSDAIDIGEEAKNILIDSNFIYNITDKGVSVGQKSTATIQNNTFMNCNQGMGLKDSCHVLVNHCTFYNVGTPIASFEKNAGSTGGNAIVRNSILSNSINASFLCDNRSTLSISYSLSDNDSLPDGYNNVFGNPLFANPVENNFDLLPLSPCIGSATNRDMGTLYKQLIGEVFPQISGIYYNTFNTPDRSEFIIINNPSEEIINLSEYQISGGIEFTFPDGTYMIPGGNLFIAKDIANPPKQYYPSELLEWTNGSLANEGESIKLLNNFGIVLDKVRYSPELPWPVIDSEEDVLMLKSSDVDNHFGENWIITNYFDLIINKNDTISNELTLYPNPVSESVFIQADDFVNSTVKIFTLEGKIIIEAALNINGYTSINLSDIDNGIYLVRIGDKVKKLIVVH